MESAVHLNGRTYRAGDYFEYLLSVPRNQHARARHDDFKGVGRALALFLVPTSTHPEGNVMVPFTSVGVRSREGNLILLDNPSAGSGDLQCVHVDSIICKLRVVPADDVGTTGLYSGMGMWEAR